jgi:general secretion pathway protein D
MRYLTYVIIFNLSISALVLSGCSAGQKSFSKAEQFEAEGNYEAAMYSYAEAFRNEPESVDYRVRFFNARDAAATQHYKRGVDQYERGDYVGALAEFQTASALDASQTRFSQKIVETTRLKDAQLAYREGIDFEKANKFKEANRAYLVALELNPANKEYQAALVRIGSLRKSKLEGFELSLKSSKPITLKFKDAKIKDVYKIITQLTGINFIFDEAVKDQPVSIYLENATFQQSMDLLTNMNKLDSKVLNESTVLVFPRTPEKSKQYNDLTLRTFHLSYMDAKKAVNLIRTMLQVKKIHVNEETNSLVVRDTADVVAVIEKIIDANDVPDPEVILEVEIIEVTDKNAKNVGLLLSSYGVSMGMFNNNVNPPVAMSDSLNNVTITGGSGSGATSGSTVSTNLASISSLVKAFSIDGYGGYVTVPSATYNFGKSLSNAQILVNPKIRVRNKEKAKFNVGTRVPITTTTTNSGTSTQVNVQYVDVGVKVNAEPQIQLNNEIIIKLSVEASQVINKETVGGKDSATTVVTIGTRNLDTVLSLKDGETSVIGGLIGTNKTESQQKIFMLGDLPLIGPLISSNNTGQDKTELIMAITPRLVRSVTVPQNNLMSFDSGKEDDPSLRRPMASFDQEPVFEGEAKPVPAKSQVKPTAAGMTPVPAPAAAQPQTPAQSAGTGMPAGDAVKQPVPGGLQGAIPAPGIITVPPPAPAAAGDAPADAVVPVPATAQPPAGTAASPVAPAASPVGPATPAAAPPAAPAPAKRGLVQIAAPAGIDVGQQFSVDIKAGDVQDLAGASLVLSYNPGLVEYVSATEGGFMKKEGKATIYSASANPAEGTLTINLSRASNSGGVTGTGTLVSVLFRAKSKGAASFGFQRVNFTSAAGNPLEMLPFSTAVTVR